MRKLAIVAFLVFVMVPAGFPQQAKAPPAPGADFPKVVLTAPDTRSERSYLGLSGRGKFDISQIKAPVVILEILSIYCPYCQNEAPNINELYRMIEADANLRGKIVIVGLGAGNSAYEAGAFKKKYSVPFPIIPDPEFAAYGQIGEVRTPHFIGIRKTSEGDPRVFYSKTGAIGDPAEFLAKIKKAAGIKELK
ncbi:MAG: redoxin domain-containing protein [Syntrophales bacterium]|nr:redoxin domain-containing protein [Syntrophales bacterium]MDD5532034.1 redoxin domain-containing protein [Syntrophales bacterium]